MPDFRCVNCLGASQSDSLDPLCESCGSTLILSKSFVPRLSRISIGRSPSGVWRFRELLPHPRSERLVTLGEGGTPLLRAGNLGSELKLLDLFIKDETRNPTGSFIDRGSTVLLSLAKDRGVTSCSCVTTGNLGASVAAYCAKAGIHAEVTIRPSTDRAKLYQMIAFGAQIVASREGEGGGDATRTISVTAGNPYILEGEKTTCFEIVQDLGWKPPDVILVPVGTGGHLSMFWRALADLKQSGLADRSRCRLMGVQVSARPTGTEGLGRSAGPGEAFTELEESEPFLWEEAKRAVEASGGRWLRTTVEETIEATGLLARTEGVFAEPAAASVVASLRYARANGMIDAGETVVCVITGAGLKDTKAISRLSRATRHVVVREESHVGRIQVGSTKLRLLRLLSSRPRFGYDLWRELSSERMITTASIYQHLEELQVLGLARQAGITTSKGRERIFYELTGKGAEILLMAGKLEGR